MKYTLGISKETIKAMKSFKPKFRSISSTVLVSSFWGGEDKVHSEYTTCSGAQKAVKSLNKVGKG